jgi:LmbE family N-acetylglucosaminyl deacetylase
VKVFDPDPSLRWLFCLTHPDDEISIAAWIKRLTEAGADVYMSWTHDTPEREAEARAVASMLGVPQENLIFHHAKDGHVVSAIWDLLPRFQEMMGDVKPDRVACGAFEQGHIDHDATNFLVNHSFSGPILEIPFYHPYTRRIQRINRFADVEGEEVVELSLEEQELKLNVAKSYPSQNIWKVLFWYEIFRKATLQKGPMRSTERMRWQTHKAFLKPNLPEPLRTKVRNSDQWHRWIMTVGPIALELAEDRETLVGHGKALLS